MNFTAASEVPMSDAFHNPPEIDLYSAASFSHGHPFAQYAWLRENAPVYSHPAPDGGTFWAVTRYEEIRFVERNPAIFSSAPTVTIEDGFGLLRNFLAMDDPEHGVLRRMVVPRLMPRAVRDRVPALNEIARTVVDEVCEKGECDIVEDFAGLMAGYTAADFLGIGRSDGRRLHELFMIVHSSPDVKGAEAMAAAVGELVAMGQTVFAEKTKAPQEDVFSMYANAEIDGRPTTEEEFLGTFILLTDGSLDTSRNLISGGMLQMFREADKRRALCADLDGLMPSAVEEMLRWLSPVVYIRRVAQERIELADQVIEPGDRVAVYFGSGNRDSAVFDEPDMFDMRRHPNEHIAFGAGGPHFCVGSHLGRAEGAVMLREILTRLPDIEQNGPEQWAATSLTSGLAALPATFTAEPRS
jgi:cytochrome P450